jgi:hypothetical protein
MAIAQLHVKIAGGAGGPNDDSIPVYGDDKAPNGEWAYAFDGKTQLMWQNGKELICVDPETVPQVNFKSFFSLKSNGQINYARVWLIGEDGKGVDYQGKPTWVEYSKLVKVSQPEPEPEPEPEPAGEWVEYDVKWEGGRVYLKKV